MSGIVCKGRSVVKLQVSASRQNQDNPVANCTHEHLVPTTDTALHGGGPPSQDMARLQLAPQHPVRPNGLLSKPIAPPLPTPTPSRSVQRQQSPVIRSKSPVKPTSSRLPYTPKEQDEFDFEGGDAIYDIDEIDLTGDNVTTSSFGDFGQPTQLWSEGAATRPEPTPAKRGKKRKSEEYTEDIQNCRPSSHRLHKSRALNDNALKEETDDFDPAQAGGPMDFDEEIGMTQTTIKEQKRRYSLAQDILSIASQGTRVMEDLHRSRPSSRQESSAFHSARTSVTSAKRKVIEDTDDETDAVHQRPKRESSQPLQEVSEPAKIEAPGTPLLGERIKAKIEEDKSAQLWPPSNTEDQRGALEVVRTTIAVATPDPASSSLPPMTSSTSSTKLSKNEEAFLQRFLRLPQQSCTGILNRLRTAKNEVNEKAVEEAEELGYITKATKEQKNVITTRIQAVQSVLNQRMSLASLIAQKDEMKMKLRHLLEKDESDDEQDSLSAELRKLKDEVERAGSAMFVLLQQAGYATDESIKAISNENMSRSPSRVSRDVLVASTQHPQTIRGTPSKARADRSSDLPLGLSQPITQTPLSIRASAQRFNDSFRGRSPEQLPPVRPFPLSHNRATSDRILSPTRARTVLGPSHSSRAPTLQRSKTTTDVAGPAYERDTRDNETFTRNMATPPPHSFSEDEYEDDNNIEDMLEAAEAYEQSFEQPLPAKSTSRTTSSRGALAEVTNGVKSLSPEKRQSAPAPLPRYQWTSDVMAALKKRFHLSGFRKNQLEAINATLAGKDGFVLMPTGGGKSLCYQLPSVISSGETRGVTIVISPLLSLMQDQVDHLQKLKIQAFLVNSEVTAEHRQFVFEALSGPNPDQFIQLLYVTPEMLAKSQRINNIFSQLHKRDRLARIVIDEAHCVSQWGHDFRPDYKELGVLRRQYPGVPVMALTATATENVKLDVMHNLGMDGCDVFTQSFNRPNLTYEVRKKATAKNTLESIANIITDQYRGMSGIVYCLSRKNCEKVAQDLKTNYGVKAAHYHAGMEPHERITVQKKWQAGEHDVIVATIAFGMGIDKPDVRYVIHHTIPKSLEGYYQETGRAGRDGQQSGCYLYYGYGDTSSIKSMIEKSEGNEEQKQRQKLLLRNMVQFCENRSDCRRQQVLAYFNEHFQRENCQGTCDNCNSETVFESKDFTEHARNAIRLVKQVRAYKVTLVQCMDIYRGARGKTNAGEDVSELREAGLGSDLDRGDVERLFYRLLSDDVFQEVQEINRGGFPTSYIQLGPNCMKYERGTERLSLQIRISPTGKSKGKAKGPAPKASRKRTKANDDNNEMDYPVSTCVSSPIQDRSQRKLKRRNQVVESDDGESDAAFEVGGPAHRSGRAGGRGSILTLDEQIDQLDEVHRHVLNDFVDNARKMIDKVVREKSLRQRPISDSTLKTIGMTFPLTEDALCQLDGINRNKLKSCGPGLLRLIQTAHRDYQAMIQAQGGLPPSQASQDASVVEISDDVDSDGEVDESENSHYFNTSTEVEQFNQRTSQIQTYSNTSKKPSSRNSSSQPRRKSFPFKKNYARKGKNAGSGGVTKKKRGSGAKNSTGSSTGNSVLTAFQNQGGSRSGSAARRGNIGMMPT